MEFPFRGLVVFLRTTDKNIAKRFVKSVASALVKSHAHSDVVRAVTGVVSLMCEISQIPDTQDYRAAVTLFSEERGNDTDTVFDGIKDVMYRNFFPQIKAAEGDTTIKGCSVYWMPATKEQASLKPMTIKTSWALWDVK